MYSEVDKRQTTFEEVVQHSLAALEVRGAGKGGGCKGGEVGKG